MVTTAMRALVLEFLAVESDRPTAATRADLPEEVTQLGRGFYLRVRRTCRSAMLLHDAGYESEAAPLRRSMFEHGLSLLWIADSPQNALDSFRTKSQYGVSKLAPHLEGWNVDGALVQGTLKEVIPANSENTLSAVTKQLERYAPGLEPVYWVESELSHPSLASARVYFDDAIEPARDPDGPLAALLSIATTGYNRLLEGQPLTHRLDELESRRRELDGATRATTEHPPA